MITFSVEVSNQEAEALRRELPKFIAPLLGKMAGEVPDWNDSATPTHRVLSALLDRVRSHLKGVKEKGNVRKT